MSWGFAIFCDEEGCNAQMVGRPGPSLKDVVHAVRDRYGWTSEMGRGGTWYNYCVEHSRNHPPTNVDFF